MTFDGRIEARFAVPADTEIEATTSAGTVTVTVTAGDYWLSDLLEQLADDLNDQATPTSGTWSTALSSSTGQVTIAVSTGTYSIVWTSTDLRDLLGFTVNVAAQSSATGAAQAKGLWIPDRPLNIANGRIASAPVMSGLRTTESPTGVVIGISGTRKYVHTGLQYRHVEVGRVWEGEATLANASFEQFIKDTQLSDGHGWFDSAAPLRIYAHDGTAVGEDLGEDGPESGWVITGLGGVQVERASQGWDGLWHIEIPRIVTSG